MSQEIEIINPLSYPGWDELVLSTKNYSFFHSSHWARVLHESYGYSPLYFTRIKNGRLLILVPFMEIKNILTGKRGVSLPFSDYCEPIVSEKGYVQEILDYLIQYGKEAGWKSIEIRDSNNFPKETPFASHYHGHTLELSKDFEQILSNFRDSTKRNIKKAIKEGVKVNISNSLESIRKFYNLNCLTRRKHGLPPQPYYFFKKVYEHIISKYHGFIALASYKQDIIAGAMYFHFGNKAIYKYGASDAKYQQLRANNLVMWEAIKWFSQNGCNSLFFGRTEPGNEGLRRYKKGWGTKEWVIKYYDYDLLRGTFLNKSPQLTDIPKKIFTKLPLFMLRTVGSILYKYIG